MSAGITQNAVVLDGNRVIIVSGSTPTQHHRIPLLRVFGVIQIVIGLTCVIANSVSLSNHMSIIGVTGFDVGSLVLSFLFVLTGIFPLFMTGSYRPAWKGLKITFMVLSILAAALFVPTMIILEIIILILVYITRMDSALPTVIMSLATLEFIVAIISASICCCCSSLDRYKAEDSVLKSEVPASQQAADVNNIIRGDANDPTDHFTVLSYEEPADHQSKIYDEIEDRYYESLGEKDHRERYDQLTQADGRQPEKYLELGPKSPTDSYIQLQNGLHTNRREQDSYLELGQKSSTYSYDQLQKDSRQDTSYKRSSLELSDKTGSRGDTSVSEASNVRPTSQTFLKETFGEELRHKNKYDTFVSVNQNEQTPHQAENVVTQRYSYLDASSGV